MENLSLCDLNNLVFLSVIPQSPYDDGYTRRTLNHLGQQTHGFWAKSGLCSNTLNNCFNQEVGDEKSILELEFLI
ncbi:BnaA01g34920D [Brassica napus]|uniref:BnaA01g34920D protein n=1 Tax=Brassica napus TaxID=3708 RepID=A0A078JHT1_BRANA|nr:BnaA01g34920D [Brassica napus]